MLRSLRSNPVLTVALTVALVVVAAVLSPMMPGEPKHFTPLSGLLLNASDSPNWLPPMVLGIALLITVMAVNVVITRLEIISGRGVLAGWSFMLVVLIVMPAAPTWPILMSSMMIVVAVGQLALLSHPEKATLHAFNGGFLMSLASLLYLPSVLMVLVAIPAFFYGQSVNVRQVLTFVLALVTPYWLAMAGWYSAGHLQEFLEAQFAWSPRLLMSTELITSWPVIIALATVMAVTLLSLASSAGKRVIVQRKNLALLVWVLSLSLGITLMDARMFPVTLLMVTPPVSIFAADMFHRGMGKFIPEAVHIAMMATAGFLAYLS